MIEFVSAQCPNCGSELKIEKSRAFAYCSYCGTKIIIDNSNERVYRRIDEAELKWAEVDREIKMRELDLEEQTVKHRKYMIALWIIALVVLILLGFRGSFLWFLVAVVVARKGFKYWDRHPIEGKKNKKR